MYVLLCYFLSFDSHWSPWTIIIQNKKLIKLKHTTTTFMFSFIHCIYFLIATGHHELSLYIYIYIYIYIKKYYYYFILFYFMTWQPLTMNFHCIKYLYLNERKTKFIWFSKQYILDLCKIYIILFLSILRTYWDWQLHHLQHSLLTSDWWNFMHSIMGNVVFF